MIKLMDSVDFYMLVSMHIRGEVLFWLDTDTLDRYAEYYPTAARFAEAFGYVLLPPEDVSDRGGYLVNSARLEYGRFCMTVELCPYISVDPYPLSLFDRAFEPVRALGLIMGDEALKMEELPKAVDVFLDGRPLAFYPQRPIMEDGCALVPAFELLGRCGAEWEWWEPKGVLKARLNGSEVELRPGSRIMTVNGAEVRLDAPPRFEGGTLLLPACQVLRSLRLRVDWDAENLNAFISRP